MLPANEVLSVRRPRRIADLPLPLLGDLLRVAAIRVHHPEVFEAVAVAGEGDARTVGAEARLGLVGRAATQQARGPPFDGEQVDITKQVEDDLPAVGAHVQGHPGPLVGGEFDGLRRAVPLGDVPGVFVLLRGELRWKESDQKYRNSDDDAHALVNVFVDARVPAVIGRMSGRVPWGGSPIHDGGAAPLVKPGRARYLLALHFQPGDPQ